MYAVTEQLSDPVNLSSICQCEEKIRIWKKKKKRVLKKICCQFQSVAVTQHFLLLSVILHSVSQID